MWVWRWILDYVLCIGKSQSQTGLLRGTELTEWLFIFQFGALRQGLKNGYCVVALLDWFTQYRLGSPTTTA